MVTNVSNSVKILTKVVNDSGYIKIYTSLNSNIVVGDTVYICSYSDIDINADLDNYIYFTKNSLLNIHQNPEVELLLQGYNVIKVDAANNSITINRLFSTLTDMSGLSDDNFYLGKVYFKNSNIRNTSVNGVILKKSSVLADDISVNWVQGILLGGSLESVIIKNKFTDDYITTNTEIINGDVISTYSYNNRSYGYNIFYSKFYIISIEQSTIYNGVFRNCEIIGSDNISPALMVNIYNGYFDNCLLYNNFIINNGYYLNTSILSLNTIWNNGEYNPIIPSLFKPLVWNDGTWLYGNTPAGLRWLNGNFNGNEFIATCEWVDGNFNGNLFNGNTWNGGNFNNGTFNTGLIWDGGIFNNGNFNGSWATGTFNNGNFNGSWTTGIFNDGVFNGSHWYGGVFNNGDFNSKSVWHQGDFNNGNFRGLSWLNGNFYDGLFSTSVWSNGNFYNGDMIESSWLDGNFYYGRLFTVKWEHGNFYNGISNFSDFKNVEWYDGIFNGDIFGVTGGVANWHNGSFNSGKFGQLSGSASTKFLGGNFYDGIFNGQFLGGYFYLGDYSGASIPPSKPMNREYVAYIKEQTVKKLNKKLTPNPSIGMVRF